MITPNIAQLLPTPIERAEALQNAVRLALISSLEDLSELGAIRGNPEYTVALNDPTGHLPLQDITPGDIGIHFETTVLSPRLYVVSRTLSRRQLAQAQERHLINLGRKKPNQPPRLRLRLDNLAIFQPIVEDRFPTWDTMD